MRYLAGLVSCVGVRRVVARALAVTVLAACGGGPTKVPTSVIDTTVRDNGLDELMHANGNPGALARLFDTPLEIGGMWFEDPQCRARFGTAGVIDAAHLGAFAKCVATVRFAASDRTNTLPNVGVVTYGPHIELEVLFARRDAGMRIRAIGYVSQQRPEDAIPTVQQSALEIARAEPPPSLDETVRAALEAEQRANPKLKGHTSWLKVCLDERGTVTSVRPRSSTTITAQDAFVTNATQWKFRPYLLGGQPAAVCSLFYVEHPAGVRKGDVLPHPLPPSHADVPVVSLAGFPKRIAGEDPLPTERLFRLTREYRRDGVDGSLLYCIDQSGTPTDVVLLRSTGIPPADESLVAGTRRMRFEPRASGGTLCTLARYVYWFETR